MTILRLLAFMAAWMLMLRTSVCFSCAISLQSSTFVKKCPLTHNLECIFLIDKWHVRHAWLAVSHSLAIPLFFHNDWKGRFPPSGWTMHILTFPRNPFSPLLLRMRVKTFWSTVRSCACVQQVERKRQHVWIAPVARLSRSALRKCIDVHSSYIITRTSLCTFGDVVDPSG